MNVKHQNNEDWNFYQSTEAGDDPVVVYDENNTILAQLPPQKLPHLQPQPQHLLQPHLQQLQPHLQQPQPQG